jgi:hypothetical protein
MAIDVEKEREAFEADFLERGYSQPSLERCHGSSYLTPWVQHMFIGWLARAESSPQAALVPEVGREEPVAWRQKLRAGGYAVFIHNPLDVHDNGMPVESLYTRPAATPEAVLVRRDDLALAIPTFDVELQMLLRSIEEHPSPNARANINAFEQMLGSLNRLKAALSAHGEGR